MVRYDYGSQTLDAFSDSAHLAITVGLGLLSGFLFIKAVQYERKKEHDKAQMLKYFSFGFGFSTLAYIFNNFKDFYAREFIFTPLFPTQSTVIPIISLTVDLPFVINALLLGGALFFIVGGIEKQVNASHKQQFSLNIGLASLGLLLGYFIPSIQIIMLLWFTIAIILGALKFIYTYGIVIHSSMGLVRIKALFNYLWD